MSKDAEPNVTVQLPLSVWEDIKKLADEWERSGRWTVIWACKELIKPSDIDRKKIEYFDRMVRGLMNRDGSYLKISREGMEWGIELAEQPARDRIKERRGE